MTGFNWALPLIPLPASGAKGTPAPGPSPASTNGSIREEIDPKFCERYEKWKATFLSTNAGQQAWQRFASDPNFTLVIRMSEKDEKALPSRDRATLKQGGHVVIGDYKWDANGKLVAATIVLGSDLNKGYPPSRDYPIGSSLGPPGEDRSKPAAVGKGEIVAATKLAHELGHVTHTASLDPAGAQLYQRRMELAPEHSTVARSLSELGQLEKKAKDPAEKAEIQANIADRKTYLAELEAEMGGKPEAFALEREHRAEAHTIPFLQEKLGPSMPSAVKDAIAGFQKKYPGW